ncbi:hypothetical protein C2E25_01255 [Geothermobacter hydrogeniphilus]|uniref:Uncharacterized protein n=1 Tax=Geothermobacter hydrogeniphilus TaxID=1969733 RepID=A0A2K2HE04_9BACT|nr:hypothetical protein [Geothermobacter hydrogeniphilus]PNU21520.1 hypothetical protein C2E25_01255 [Geothermobacter hydrogeniphilus]
MSRRRRQKAAFRLIVLLLVTILGGCVVIGPQPDGELGRRQRQQAEQLIKGHDYQAAAKKLALATINLPNDNETFLRYGEVLEALGRQAEAAEVYHRALKNDGDRKNQLRYRLALLQTLQLDQLPEAVALQRQLPPETFQAGDLQAVILLQQGRPRQALILLADLAKKVRAEDQAAHIAYHAALAYRSLKDDNNTYSSLYQAINRAENLGLIQQIQRFWNHPQPAGRSTGHPGK